MTPVWWLFAYVGLSTAGLLVLAVPAVRVWAAARELARQVTAGTEALAAAGERLERAVRPLEERSGRIPRG
jgi:hypothetical protein